MSVLLRQPHGFEGLVFGFEGATQTSFPPPFRSAHRTINRCTASAPVAEMRPMNERPASESRVLQDSIGSRPTTATRLPTRPSDAFMTEVDLLPQGDVGDTDSSVLDAISSS